MLPDAKLWPGKWAAYKQASRFMQLDWASDRETRLSCFQTTQKRTVADKSDFLSYRDSEGQQADFRALRHTFLSRLGRAGVSAKVMQRLARHSTVEHTIGHYTHANVFDLAVGVDSLPSLPIQPTGNECQSMRATGTDHHTADGPNVLPSCLPEIVAKPRAEVHSRAAKRSKKPAHSDEVESEKTAEKTQVFPDGFQRRGRERPAGRRNVLLYNGL